MSLARVNPKVIDRDDAEEHGVARMARARVVEAGEIYAGLVTAADDKGATVDLGSARGMLGLPDVQWAPRRAARLWRLQPTWHAAADAFGPGLSVFESVARSFRNALSAQTPFERPIRYCLGCCWALMLAMFVAGVMNLLWMAALTVLMTLEKAVRRGDRLARGTGVALVAACIWLLDG